MAGSQSAHIHDLLGRHLPPLRGPDLQGPNYVIELPSGFQTQGAALKEHPRSWNLPRLPATPTDPATGHTHPATPIQSLATPPGPPGHTHRPHPPNPWSHPPRLQTHPPRWALRDQLPWDAVLQALVSYHLQNLGFLLTASFLLFLTFSPSHAISSDDCIWPLWTQSQVQGNCLWDLSPWMPLTFNSAHDESSTLLSRNLALPSVPYTWEPPTRFITPRPSPL